jgi:hypothetical protein
MRRRDADGGRDRFAGWGQPRRLSLWKWLALSLPRWMTATATLRIFGLLALFALFAGASAHLRKPPFRPEFAHGHTRWMPPESDRVHKKVPPPPTGMLGELGRPRCDGTRPLRGLFDPLWKDLLVGDYGIQDPWDYELNHFIPLCLGGPDMSEGNLWLEKRQEAVEKDKDEQRLCEAVCASRMTQDEAIQEIRAKWLIARLNGLP